MGIGFAKKELEDAEDRLQEGNVDAAELFVENAQRDLEDYFEAETIGDSVRRDKFDQGVKEFLAAESTEERLSVLDRLQDYVEGMAEQDQ